MKVRFKMSWNVWLCIDVTRAMPSQTGRPGAVCSGFQLTYNAWVQSARFGRRSVVKHSQGVGLQNSAVPGINQSRQIPAWRITYVNNTVLPGLLLRHRAKCSRVISSKRREVAVVWISNSTRFTLNYPGVSCCSEWGIFMNASRWIAVRRRCTTTTNRNAIICHHKRP